MFTTQRLIKKLSEQDEVAGNTYYVKGSSAAGYAVFNKRYAGTYSDGSQRVHNTIASALTAAVANRGDRILLAPGSHTITAVLTAKADVKVQAMVQDNPAMPSVTITGNIANLLEVDVSGAVFEGIKFLAAGATVANLVDIADAATVNGVTFRNCVFDGDDDTTVVGINLADGTFVTTGLVVEGCTFKNLSGTGINVGVLGMPFAVIENNVFSVDLDSATAIALADTSAFDTGKGFVIRNNDFIGFDATGDEVAITIAGTANTTGVGMIYNNRFAYFAADPITQDKIEESIIQNYIGDTATGGTLVTGGS
jgi:hypothetical protein